MTNTEKTYEEEYEEMTGEVYCPEDAEMAQIRADVAEFEEECEHEFEFDYEMPDGEYQRCRFCGEGHAFYYPYSRED